MRRNRVPLKASSESDGWCFCFIVAHAQTLSNKVCYFLCLICFVFQKVLYVDILILKAPITTAADDILKYFFFNFSKKTSLDISCESSAWQTIHMKYQDLFSLTN